MKLGEYIYARRIEKGMSMTTFAYEIGRAYNNAKNIEDSKSLPRMDTMLSIAEALNVPLDTISGLNLSDRIERYREVYQNLFDQYKEGDDTLEFHCPVPRLVPIRTGTSGFDLHPSTGSLLTTLRETANLTVMEVAEKTGHLSKTVWHIEEGHDTLSLKMIFQFSELYHCPPEFIFEPFLNEKMENYIKLYNVAFDHFRNGTTPKKKKKKISKRKEGKNGTALLFIQTRKDSKLSLGAMAREMECRRVDLDRIEMGSLPSYRIIFSFSTTFDISSGVVFETVLQDRIAHFEKCHKEVMYNYLLRKSDRHTAFTFKFSRIKLRSKNPFKKVSNFILTNMKRVGIIHHNEVIRKIGCRAQDYNGAKAGRKSLNPLMIDGLAAIFGIDKYEVFNMVLEEKVNVYSGDYTRQWELYKKGVVNETSVA